MSLFTSKFLLMDGVAATTTSTGVVVGDRMNVGLQFLVTKLTAGRVFFNIDVSDNNKDWTPYNRILSNSAAGAAWTTLNIATPKTDMAFKPPGDNFSYLRVKMSYQAIGALVSVICVGLT